MSGRSRSKELSRIVELLLGFAQVAETQVCPRASPARALLLVDERRDATQRVVSWSNSQRDTVRRCPRRRSAALAAARRSAQLAAGLGLSVMNLILV